MSYIHSIAIKCFSAADKKHAIEYFSACGCRNSGISSDTYDWAPYVFCRDDGSIDASDKYYHLLRGKTVVTVSDLESDNLKIDRASLQNLI